MVHSGTYEPALVAVSVLIAAAASYTALDLASRMRASSGWAYCAWLATAAVTMGTGIWSMHFVGMMAFSMPGMETDYDLAPTLASMALPIVVTAVGFYYVDVGGGRKAVLAAAGAVMGAGIVAMHYTGMAAMRMSGEMSYDPVSVVVAALIAVCAAVTALWLAFAETPTWQRLPASAVMGLAISGMHYAAMAGTNFHAVAGAAHHHSPGVPQAYIGYAIAAAVFMILVLASVAAGVDRKLAAISAREAARVRESEGRFRMLLGGVRDYAIFMVDPEGRVANWNAGAERIKGYRAEEIVGRHVSVFYDEEERQAGVPERMLATAAAEGKFECEGWRLRKDGSRFWASVVIEPILSESGDLVGFAKVTRDITERVKTQRDLEEAQAALLQAQKMEAIGQLTGGVAHDFNNLLMAVIGSLDLLKRRLPEDPKLSRLVDNAMQGAQKGAALTQRMLAFARRQRLEPTAVDLVALVAGMGDLLRNSVGPTVRIETDFPEGLPRALVDANQLELALINLALNARDAMPEGGTITLTASVESAFGSATMAAGRYVCLVVTDTGIGMDGPTLARAQEPFFTTKGIGRGTGLGLSMVQGLAEQSNGRLVLESAPGEGTSATIWLPIAAQDVEVATPSVVPGHRIGRALSVLLVDDDELVLENVAGLLSEMGHDVTTAGNGADALALVRSRGPFDLIVTDQVMPGMTGLQFLAEAEKVHAGMPSILASGYEGVAPEPAHGIVKLKKPFRLDELAAAVVKATTKAPRRQKATAAA